MNLRCQCSLQLQSLPSIRVVTWQGPGATRTFAFKNPSLSDLIASLSFGRSEIAYAPLHPCRTPSRHVCFAGGARQRKPRMWKTKNRRGTVGKGNQLIELMLSLSNVKEDVYGALDAWTAWELEFPLVAVKKGLKVLQQMKEYKRVIQLSKWMLSKGQGKTLGTYDVLIQAFSAEGRIEEAELLWEKIFARYLECVPRVMFGRIIHMYDMHGHSEKALELFSDMEELGVKPDRRSTELIASIYERTGDIEKKDEVLKKFPRPNFEWRRCKGKWIRVRKYEAVDDDKLVEQHQDVERIVTYDELDDEDEDYDDSDEQGQFRDEAGVDDYMLQRLRIGAAQIHPDVHISKSVKQDRDWFDREGQQANQGSFI